MATYRYPAIVSDLPTYMIFTFHKHQGYTTGDLKRADKFGYTANTYSSIGLPVPNNLNDSLSLDWSAEQDQSLVSTVGQEIAGQLGRKASFEAMLQTGTNFEKHSAMIFNGVGAKTFNFFWSMTPQSKAEADAINHIVNIFEYASLPTVSGVSDAMFGAPDIVRVQFGGKNKFKMMTFLPCVITNVNVKYGSDVTFMVYQDGNPPEVQLSVSLTEVTSRNRQIQTGLKNPQAKK